jgi:gliding motility-associated-like protein
MAAGLSFANIGAQQAPITVTPPTSTGLEAVYVVQQFTPQITVSYEATGTAAASTAKWYRFSSLGGGFAEELTSTSTGNKSTVQLGLDSSIANSTGMGYIVEYDGRQHCFWVVNYWPYECSLNALNFASADEQECNRTALLFDGAADRIIYYNVNGAAQTLSREMTLSYNTLSYDTDKQQYEQVPTTETLDYADEVIRVDAPLCNTTFTLSTDRFSRQWGNDAQITSDTFETNAVDCETYATQVVRDNDNERRDSNASLGGSGPAEITFTAETTDAVVYHEWQFARDQAFENIDLRIQENEVTHIFTEYGTTYVRFVADNNAGTCEYIGTTYEVYIGESKLECPNAFSPYGSEGTNDIWKVSYKSIIDFDCHIFNRWGLEMAHLTDPSQGWDGTYNGKLVPAGVYYYVIKASGTDGQTYKLSGDINILKYSNRSTSN